MKKTKTVAAKETQKNLSFTKFLSDPVIATALLVFAFIALMFSLNEFLAARGLLGG